MYDGHWVGVRLQTIRTNRQQSKFKRLQTIESDERQISRLTR